MIIVIMSPKTRRSNDRLLLHVEYPEMYFADEKLVINSFASLSMFIYVYQSIWVYWKKETT